MEALTATVADKLDMSIHVTHFPPGTSKWNKKELREPKVECEEFHGEWNYVIRSRMDRSTSPFPVPWGRNQSGRRGKPLCDPIAT